MRCMVTRPPRDREESEGESNEGMDGSGDRKGEQTGVRMRRG